MTSADIVHEFQAYSHLGEKGGGGGLSDIFIHTKSRTIFGVNLLVFSDDPKRYPQNLHTPKNIHFCEHPQRYFEPQNGASPRMNENIMVPPPPPFTLSSQTEAGAGGVQTQITEKNSDKGVFVGFFCNYIFLRFNRVETFIGGGGGATFYHLLSLLFFFFWGGGGVGCKSLFL